VLISSIRKTKLIVSIRIAHSIEFSLSKNPKIHAVMAAAVWI
jgi:hypothetical protein